MLDSITIFLAGVFLLAGLVKGVIGLGLPTLSMGLLSLVMRPAEAAAILIAPALITNLWQMLMGRHLASVVRRLWPVMLGVIGGTLWGADWLITADARLGKTLLGITLTIYALSGFFAVPLSLQPRKEIWLGPLVGAATGLISAATGVFVMPAVPYLQALGFSKEDFVQALGLSFTVSTLALALALASTSTLNWSLGPMAIGTTAVACLGMLLGQVVRQRLTTQKFRLIFFLGLLMLGVYLAAHTIL
ncbi:MAG: sulfite exporter TauE/SafE family protein [Rhodospirillales bacterium]|nr:sulfite exporter TauE/SafE family protein [Rhodospirillales bacterium]